MCDNSMFIYEVQFVCSIAARLSIVLVLVMHKIFPRVSIPFSSSLVPYQTVNPILCIQIYQQAYFLLFPIAANVLIWQQSENSSARTVVQVSWAYCSYSHLLYRFKDVVLNYSKLCKFLTVAQL